MTETYRERLTNGIECGDFRPSCEADVRQALTDLSRLQGLVEEAREGLSTLFRWPRVQEHSEFGVGYNVCAEEIGETARSLLAKLEGKR